MKTYSALAAGAAAAAIIRQAKPASVMGVTSRGIFCTLGDSRVFFVSYEKWRGPLTVNINLETESSVDRRYLTQEQRFIPRSFTDLSPGSSVNLTQDGIHFCDLGITVITADAPAWMAELRPINRSRLSAARENLAGVARIVLAGGNSKGWSPLITGWAGIDITGEIDSILSEVEIELKLLAESFRTGDKKAILQYIGNLLGKGPGLTPSGDDFLIGLLLGLHAAAGLSRHFMMIIQISDSLKNQARIKTTTLSANLITCALEGQADERLISAMDGILWGSLEVDECARRLKDYGSSSGSDTLLGMAMAIQLIG